MKKTIRMMGKVLKEIFGGLLYGLLHIVGFMGMLIVVLITTVIIAPFTAICRIGNKNSKGFSNEYKSAFDNVVNFIVD